MVCCDENGIEGQRWLGIKRCERISAADAPLEPRELQREHVAPYAGRCRETEVREEVVEADGEKAGGKMECNLELSSDCALLSCS